MKILSIEREFRSGMPVEICAGLRQCVAGDLVAFQVWNKPISALMDQHHAETPIQSRPEVEFGKVPGPEIGGKEPDPSNKQEPEANSGF
jgi:hypothetical protein